LPGLRWCRSSWLPQWYGQSLLQQAMPDGVELPPAVTGQPYPNPLAGVKKWYQLQPPEPDVGHLLPHFKYADWTGGKKGRGGSWGHIFFLPSTP
jgi:hypothetical protein